MYWDIQHVKNNMKFQLIHPVNLSKKGASIKVFHLRIGFMDLNKSVILIEKRTIRAYGSLGPRTIMFIFYSPYKYMYLKKNSESTDMY